MICRGRSQRPQHEGLDVRYSNQARRKSNSRPRPPRRNLARVGSLLEELLALAIVLSDPFRHVDGDRAHRNARAVAQGRIPASGRNN